MRIVQKILAEAFPWTVNRGFTRVFIRYFSQLYIGEVDMHTYLNTLGARVMRLQLASIFASVLFQRNFFTGSITSFERSGLIS